MGVFRVTLLNLVLFNSTPPPPVPVTHPLPSPVPRQVVIKHHEKLENKIPSKLHIFTM